MSIFCSIPFAAWLFSTCGPGAPLAVGYVEGDFVLLAPIDIAQVQTVSVRRGERDTALALVGQLRTLDPADRLGFGVVEALLGQTR